MTTIRHIQAGTLSRTARIWAVGIAFCLFSIWPLTESSGDVPPSLKQFNILSLEDPQIMTDFIADRNAAIQLGKALFWDMQLGSDGVMACASCHFQAGADVRKKNQLSPGLLAGDTAFGNADFPQFRPNYEVTLFDFPFHRKADPDDPESAILKDTNDVMSSNGVFSTLFLDVNTSVPGQKAKRRDLVTRLEDPLFNVSGTAVRKAPGRNAPSAVNAVLNFSNFHDGRANNVFNGQNPFGALDASAAILVSVNGTLEEKKIRITNSSLASQAVGPPLSPFEMSGAGRTFPKIGKKMLSLRPLGNQLVHPADSVLGPLSRASLDPTGRLAGKKGLNTTYKALIAQAFQPQYWNSDKIVTYNGQTVISDRPGRRLTSDEYTQMEANFPLFFGLAIQLYESLLVSDDTRFDRFAAGNQDALSRDEVSGLGIFIGKGNCVFCHAGFALSSASIPHVLALEPLAPNEPALPAFMEFMGMATGAAVYDTGFYNIASRRPGDDPGKGGTAPFINPLTNENYPLSFSKLAMLKRDGLLPPDVAAFVPNLPPGQGNPDPDRVAVDGAIKVPGIRNVELTGPYFSNGIAATLMQVVEFYDRGGNFPAENLNNLAPLIKPLSLNDVEKNQLVSFLLALTDDRVRNEAAPFDHPEIIIPNGQRGDSQTLVGNCGRPKKNGLQKCDEVLLLPATGAAGRPGLGLAGLRPFLDDSGDPRFHFRGEEE